MTTLWHQQWVTDPDDKILLQLFVTGQEITTITASVRSPPQISFGREKQNARWWCSNTFVMKPPHLHSLLTLFRTQDIAFTFRKRTELRTHQASWVFIPITSVTGQCAVQGMIFAKTAEGSSELLAPLQEENEHKPLMAILWEHGFAWLFHWWCVTGPLGEDCVAVRLSNPVCRNPFQRAECSNGQMKTDTLHAVGLRDV